MTVLLWTVCESARGIPILSAVNNARLKALCPGLPMWAGTRKVKPIWILLKQETVSGSGISWAICKSAPRSRQITTPATHHSVFYRLDALPTAQPTASKHWKQSINSALFTRWQQWCGHLLSVLQQLVIISLHHNNIWPMFCGRHMCVCLTQPWVLRKWLRSYLGCGLMWVQGTMHFVGPDPRRERGNFWGWHPLWCGLSSEFFDNLFFMCVIL